MFLYVIETPFVGPTIRREAPSPGQRPKVTVSGGTNPALGDALMAAFVPVSRQGERFVPVDGRASRPAHVAQVGWVSPCKCDDDRNFSLNPPAHLWDGNITGVLMALVYDQAGPPPSNFPGSPQRHEVVTRTTPKGPIAEVMPISELLPEVAQEMERKLDQLLHNHAAARLNPAVIRKPA